MSFITLTTDFGTKDHFVGAVKGAIYSELADAKIVDITHEISPFNITETAYILKNSYKSFPKGTIHIVGVDSELSSENKHIALELDGHFFVCPDNGLISMIASEINPTKIVEINIHDRIESSFPVLDIFVKVACFIARGGNLTVIGKEIKEYKRLIEIQPKVNQAQNQIIGGVLYIDNYGNLISNISKKMFQEIGKGRTFRITASRYSFVKIYNKYNEITGNNNQESRQFDGNRLAIFNSAAYLEIAIYRSNLKSVGGASTLLGLEYRDPIIIDFFTDSKPEYTVLK
ncbi:MULTISPECIES: S-adenosyl-l-methionine hydroxide adenosyltransferase family protein [unclassified Polaribacter]|uniref:SAM hydrolase/SAM-dependent halogenase family protein n=1 Tax=unclassified Polaribacter TaxID=196858 RepID=UPI0011BF2D69|nr:MULTISPECIES: SAM-dependent chlorinase/fluorinase [unclassified Polaribacter]TXD53024.1 SAM-dependent chlorinase/fluorinase [Polaribacter sp. IC063]TXD59475.1 SAM-dependent chlorinase/fluorinase [Polaribacter sp. IC066]